MNKFFIISIISIYLMLVSCTTTENVKPDVRLEPSFSEVSDKPQSYEQAAYERQKIIAEIDDILASMTGDQFQLTNDKFLNKLRYDYNNIQRGMSRLNAERTEHGISFQQDMDAFLQSLKDMLDYLRIIHKELEYIPLLPDEGIQTQPDSN